MIDGNELSCTPTPQIEAIMATQPNAVELMKNGFIVVPFKLPPVNVLRDDSTTFHYMFAKKHQSPLENEQNSLFIVNIPLLTQLDNIKTTFNKICSQVGTVSHIEDLLYNDEFGVDEVDLSSLTSNLMTEDDPKDVRYTPRNTALLKFVDQSSLDNCWNALRKYSTDKRKSLIDWEYKSPSIATFINFYKPLDVDALKEDIYTHMKVFEQREQEAQETAQSSIVDEDGFTLVVGKNTKSLNSIRKKILNKNPLSKHETKVKPPSSVDKKAKKDFYRFQIRERKKQEINQLLTKFKEDQEKVKIMKAKKRFNPYT